MIGSSKIKTPRVLRILLMAAGLAVSGMGHKAMSFNLAIWPGDDASVWASGLNVTNVLALSGGDGHAMALRADGSVVSWYGSTGNEMGVTNGIQIASGWCHDLAVKADGT